MIQLAIAKPSLRWRSVDDATSRRYGLSGARGRSCIGGFLLRHCLAHITRWLLALGVLTCALTWYMGYKSAGAIFSLLGA